MYSGVCRGGNRGGNGDGSGPGLTRTAPSLVLDFFP